jgi:hypothetical protein
VLDLIYVLLCSVIRRYCTDKFFCIYVEILIQNAGVRSSLLWCRICWMMGVPGAQLMLCVLLYSRSNYWNCFAYYLLYWWLYDLQFVMCHTIYLAMYIPILLFNNTTVMSHLKIMCSPHSSVCLSVCHSVSETNQFVLFSWNSVLQFRTKKSSSKRAFHEKRLSTSCTIVMNVKFEYFSISVENISLNIST